MLLRSKCVDSASVEPVQQDVKRRMIVMTVLAFLAYASVLLVVFLVVNREVPDPYMDEVFHVDQAQRYCAGNMTVCIIRSIQND